ncbi:MAG: CD225/dispanin family protein [Armatimonadetes bacterium]|nr:CD225/dispanin family protein [Armatimonadota bacterium]MBS1701263.1 CD225/dispanin family protein [Armatimonadota bacterium]MBS1728490.1 CD225/dispanin family protein [Armatimonadota bacterium]
MGYGQAYNRPYIPVENHLVKAILSTFFCCLPLGIVAIVYASQVDGHARRGDHQMALDTARKADIWANWSIGLVVVYIFGYLLLVGLAASSGHSTYR